MCMMRIVISLALCRMTPISSGIVLRKISSREKLFWRLWNVPERVKTGEVT